MMQRYFQLVTIITLIPILGAPTQAARRQKVLVTRYGAVPNDGQNDAEAVQKAIADCKAGGKPCTLFFPPGQFDFYDNGVNKMATLLFNDMNNIEIMGSGSLKTRLAFYSPRSAIGLYDCQSITIKRLSIEWPNPPFSTAEVLACDDKTLDVKVLPQFPVSDKTAVPAYMDFDAKTRLPRRQGWDAYNNVQKVEWLGPQVLRLHLFNPTPMEKGTWVLLRHVTYGCNAFSAMHCKDLAFEDVLIYSAPGMGIRCERCENVSLKKFDIRIKPGQDRLMSVTADGSHFMDCLGDIQIENCTMEGMGDDGVNVGVMYLTIQEKVDDKTLVVGHNLKMPVPVEIGELMEFVDHATLRPYGQRTVARVEQLGKDALIRLTFDKPVPGDMKMGDVLGNLKLTPKVRIKGCHFGRNRARGILVQTHDAIIEDCTFEDCTSGGVWIATEVVFFYEGVGARNTIVRNNTFTNCCYAGPIGEGVLSCYSYLKDFKFPPEPGVHQNIIFENNVIDGSDNCGIFITGTTDIVLRDNVLKDVCRKPTREFADAAIYIMSSEDVTITGNKVLPSQQGKALKETLRLGPGCAEKTFTVKDNKGIDDQ